MTSNYVSDNKFVKKVKEKKKSRMSSSENDSRDSNSTKCTAIDIETVLCAREQMPCDFMVSDSIADYLADDVTHKIRELLHNARTKIKQSKRRTLMPKDLDSVMAVSNVERIYGPVSFDWEICDDRYSYEDPPVNLFDLAFEAKSFVQDGPAYLTSHQISTNPNVEQQYYENICQAIFSNSKQLVAIALNDLKTNKNIGNVVDQFAAFCFLTFIVGKGHKFLTLNMFKNLIYNEHISFIEPGNGLKLTCTYLVSELFPIRGESNLLQGVQKLIAIEFQNHVTNLIIFLMSRWKSLKPVILLTLERYINLNIANPQRVSLNIVRIICHAGVDMTNVLFWNKLSIFQVETQLDEMCLDKHRKKHELHSETDIHYELRHALWYAASQVFHFSSFSKEWTKDLSILLGDSCVPLYPHFGLLHGIEQRRTPENPRIEIRKINQDVSKKKYSCDEVFEDYGGTFVRHPFMNFDKVGRTVYAKLMPTFQPITPIDEFIKNSMGDGSPSSLLTDISESALMAITSDSTLLTSANDAGLLSNLSDSSLLTSTNNAALLTDLSNSTLLASANDAALLTNLSDSALLTSTNNAALLTDLSDSTLLASANDAALLNNLSDSALLTSTNNAALLTDLSDSPLLASANDATLLTHLSESPLLSNTCYVNSDFIIKNTKYLPTLELLGLKNTKQLSKCKCHSLLFVL